MSNNYFLPAKFVSHYPDGPVTFVSTLGDYRKARRRWTSDTGNNRPYGVVITTEKQLDDETMHIIYSGIIGSLHPTNRHPDPVIFEVGEVATQ